MGGSDSRTELSTDALSETRGTQAADQLSGVLLTPGGVQGLVLERGALFKQKRSIKPGIGRQLSRLSKSLKSNTKHLPLLEQHPEKKNSSLYMYCIHAALVCVSYPKCLLYPLHQ